MTSTHFPNDFEFVFPTIAGIGNDWQPLQREKRQKEFVCGVSCWRHVLHANAQLAIGDKNQKRNQEAEESYWTDSSSRPYARPYVYSWTVLNKNVILLLGELLLLPPPWWTSQSLPNTDILLGRNNIFHIFQSNWFFFIVHSL
jgi:hypothetical protein